MGFTFNNKNYTNSFLPNMTNAPPAHQVYDLDDVSKWSYEKDTKMPNSGTFKILKEDHTLGNIIRSQMLTNPHVLFAGYKMPHPLELYMLLKVQTSPETDPMTVLKETLESLKKGITHLQEQFQRKVENFNSSIKLVIKQSKRSST